MKIFYLIIAILTVAQGTSFSLMEWCDCSNYKSTTICNAIGYCSWINGTCSDLQCAYVSETKCSGLQTYYKCNWNTTSKVCESKTYKCSELTSQDFCNLLWGFDCIWLSSTSKCVDFTCTGMDIKTCDVYRCSYVNGVCGAPQSIDCSSKTQSTCGYDRPGDGKMCVYNDKNECKSYNVVPKDCSEYSDYKNSCSVTCTMDSSTNKCRHKQCSDHASKTECTYTMDLYTLSYTPCYWNGSSCTEATNENIQTFGVIECAGYTAIHYAWDLDVSKCQQCTKLAANPQMKTLKGIMDNLSSSSNEMVLGIILTMFLLD